MTATAAPPLAPDLVAGLKRLKLARIRAMAPQTLQAAKTQRWTPEELLRTFVEAEIAARDAANLRQRRTAAGFPVPKTLEEFKVAASSVPQATFDYLASLEWVRAAENCCLIGPAGTGKSHLLVALGHAAVADSHPRPLPHRRRAGRDPRPRAGRQLGRADAGPAAAPRHRGRHRGRTVPDEGSPSPRRWSPNRPMTSPGVGTIHGHQRGLQPGR